METNSSPKAQPETARVMVERLMAKGYSAQAISELMGQRVGWRTIYRWKRGESNPHQPSDIEELRRVSAALLTEE
jgi:hypothetical protein